MFDLFSYFFIGVVNNEYCIVFILELLDVCQCNWLDNLISELGLFCQFFGEIVFFGIVCGKLKQEIVDEIGLGCINVVVVGLYDIVSVVFVVFFNEFNWVYFSLGIWFLFGVEVD